jgi:hypothetical protein
MVPANAIKAMVDPVMPQITVNNPNPSFGGRNPESVDSIRVNAARAFRARDRAVTAYDYMALASGYVGVSKVKVVANNGVSLLAFVAGTNDGSNRPTMTKTELAGLRTYLRSVSMAGVDITVVDASWIPVHLRLTVHCVATAKQRDVETRVRQALATLFSFDSMDFDERLTVGDINAALFGINGVSYAVVDGIGVSPGTLGQDPIFFDQIAVSAVPYWDEQNLSLTMVGGV